MDEILDWSRDLVDRGRRAEMATGDPWAPDPGCYLTDREISGERLDPLGAVRQAGSSRART
ncbi:MAG: hypothetical protein ACYS5V_00445 [Planctomycetota bacterium]|jgi:hypothetical protein